MLSPAHGAFARACDQRGAPCGQRGSPAKLGLSTRFRGRFWPLPNTALYLAKVRFASSSLVSPRRTRLRQNSSQKASVSLAYEKSPEGGRIVSQAVVAAEQLGLLDHRQEGPVGAPARFQRRGEEAARAQLGICSSRRPEPVSRIRSRLPLRYVVRVDARS
jgi:hypothetical protein